MRYQSATPLRIFGEDSPPPIRPRASRGRTINTGGDVIAAYLADVDRQLRLGAIRSVDHVGNLHRSLDYAASNRYVGFADIVGAIPVSELRQSDLTDWLDANPGWTSAETRRRNIAAALSCFNWAAHEEELISSCPYKKTKRLKFPKVERRDATDDEAIQIFKHADEHLRRAIQLVDVTGGRTCEARAVLWPDVSWEKSVIVLNEHKTDRQLTDPEPRVVGIPPDLLADMRRWYEARRLDRDSQHVIVNRRGFAWTRRALCAAFRKLREKLKLPDDLTPYCFRHRFGTQCAMLKMSDRETADLMGHADPRTTRRYTHTSGKMEYLAAKAAEVALKRKERMASRGMANERPPEASSQEQ